MKNDSRHVINDFDPEAQDAIRSIGGSVCSMELTNFGGDVETIKAHIAEYGIARVISALDSHKGAVNANIGTLIFVCEESTCHRRSGFFVRTSKKRWRVLDCVHRSMAATEAAIRRFVS